MTAASGNHLRLSESVMAFLAGPDLEECVIGDMRERCGANGMRYWREIIISFPGFALMHLRNASRATLIRETFVALLLLATLCCWEYFVARRFSWPIARDFVGLAPLSADALCKAAYVGLFATAAGVLAIGNAAIVSRSGASRHLKIWRLLVIGALASLVPVYLYWNPGPYDGPGMFRNFQFVFIWIMIWLAAIPVAFNNRRIRAFV